MLEVVAVVVVVVSDSFLVSGFFVLGVSVNVGALGAKGAAAFDDRTADVGLWVDEGEGRTTAAADRRAGDCEARKLLMAADAWAAAANRLYWATGLEVIAFKER